MCVLFVAFLPLLLRDFANLPYHCPITLPLLLPPAQLKNQADVGLRKLKFESWWYEWSSKITQVSTPSSPRAGLPVC